MRRFPELSFFFFFFLIALALHAFRPEIRDELDELEAAGAEELERPAPCDAALACCVVRYVQNPRCPSDHPVFQDGPHRP